MLSLMLLLGILPFGVSTGSGQTVEPMPTAGVDGRMIYKVQPGDSCISISVRFGVDYKTLLANNNLSAEDCAALNVGREILLGVVSGPTATPLPTNLPPTPTPTPTITTGRICVILFEDINGDTLFETNEQPIAGGRSASPTAWERFRSPVYQEASWMPLGIGCRPVLKASLRGIITSVWQSRGVQCHHEHELPAAAAGR